MAYDEQLLERARVAIAGRRDIVEKRMFGGVAFLNRGRMAFGVESERLMVRVGPEGHEAAPKKPHVVPMDFTGRPMRGYVFVNLPGLRTDAALASWINLSLEVAANAPAKAKRKAKDKAAPKKTKAAASATRSASSFAGVPKRTLTFLRGLEAHNDKRWFDAHRDDYEAGYVAVGVQLVSALGPRLARIAKGIQYEPRVNGSMLRIHRDVRFSKDKTPYKPHLDLWFWEGERKGWNASGFFFRITPHSLLLGCGMHHFEPAQLERYRQAVLDPRAGKALQGVIAKLEAAGYTLGAATRKTVPRGFAPDHPRAELLKHDGLTAMLDTALPRELSTPAFADYCVKHYAQLAGVHAWLLKHVVVQG